MQSEDFYDIVAIIFNQIQLKLLIIKKHFNIKFLFNALYHALYIPHIVHFPQWRIHPYIDCVLITIQTKMC